MRISVLGSISILCFAFSTNAFAAPDDPPAGRSAPEKDAPAPEKVAPAPAAATEKDAPAPATPGAKPPGTWSPAENEVSAGAPNGDAPAPAPPPLVAPVPLPSPPVENVLPQLPAQSPAYDSPPPPPKAPRRSEWGAQLRFEGAAMPSDASPDAGMGGIGFSLRPRPSPFFAVDFGLDFMGGRDFNGDKRNETTLTVNPIVFLNPRNKVQVYLFAGLGFGGARVERGNGTYREYRYVGADAGVGVEFRFWKHFAFSGDVLAFVRDRSDLNGSPEFIDRATGRYTDSSTGALVRLGGTYYW
jgi:hypothetical protein